MNKETEKKVKGLLSFSPDELFENLSEDEKKELLSNCSLIHNNKAFGKICNEAYTKEILNTTFTAKTTEDQAEGRGKILGIAGIVDLIKSYNSQYMESIKKEEEYDKHSTI
jgi:hypothetical protein